MDGKVALVTGGARGQGASHGELLAQEGAKVVLGDVLDELGEQHAASLRDAGLEVEYVRLDVTSSEDWDRAIGLAEERFGLLNVLVQNAGIVRLEGFVDETEEGWRQVIDVNQTGVFLGLKHGIPALRRAGGGSIVNTSSTWGLVGAIDHAAYAASKGAVSVMTKTAALTHAADNIRVNAVLPGLVWTPMAELETEESNREAIELAAMKRAAEPIEVSYGVLFLASDEASYVTGVDLPIDGGYLAQ